MKKYNIKNKFILLSILICLIANLNGSYFLLAANDEELTEEEKAELEEEEEELEEKKEGLEEKIEKVEKQKTGLQQELNIVQQSLDSTQKAVESTKDEIKNKEHEIDRHNKQIKLLNDQNELYRKALAAALRNIYYYQNETVIFLVLKNKKSNKFLGSSDNFDTVRERVLELIDKIAETRSVAEKEKNKVEEVKEEKEGLLALQEQQEQSLASEKYQAQTELASTEVTISQLNAKLVAVESDISSLLGDSIETDDIVEAAKFASKKIGVRKGFLLGMTSSLSFLY